MKTFAAILSASAACIVCVRSAPLVGRCWEHAHWKVILETDLVGGLSSRGDYHVSELNTALVAGSKEATNSYVMDDVGEEKTHVVERDSTGVQNGYHVSELNTALVAASKDEANSYMMDDAGEDDA